jgi:hypothetical protein
VASCRRCNQQGHKEQIIHLVYKLLQHYHKIIGSVLIGTKPGSETVSCPAIL